MRLGTRICMLILALSYASASSGNAVSYTNYELDERTGTTTTGGAISAGDYVEGPVPWSWHAGPDNPAAPFWNASTSIVDELTPTAPPTFDAELVGTIPFVGTRTLTAYEEKRGHKEVAGTMVWNAVGSIPIDFNASRAVVDEDAGVIKIRVGYPLSPDTEPMLKFSFVEETGVFLYDGVVPISDPNSPDDPADSWLFGSGWSHIELLEGTDVNDLVAVQENINTLRIVAGFTEGVWSGHYVPEPSTLVLAVIAIAGLRPMAGRRRKPSPTKD